ncbi:MAG TPA: NADH-quinone oxidoreductase subunit J [Rhizomicrobium sp.]|nr:NADH-quinone oxidoreductase subunit J [Rhizomicrobium sp.]
MLVAIAFYLFSAVLVGASLMVVAGRNPVHSVLFLILAFFNAAALFVLLGAEFLAMIIAIVYVGAVAVLFLFVVMMLDIDFAEMRKGALQYLPLSALIGTILVIELVMISTLWVISPVAPQAIANATPEGMTNTVALGHILYTDYIFYFQTAGLILLVAMIGAIVLTLRHRPNVRRQSIPQQNRRSRAESMEIKNPQPGEGV